MFDTISKRKFSTQIESIGESARPDDVSQRYWVTTSDTSSIRLFSFDWRRLTWFYLDPLRFVVENYAFGKLETSSSHSETLMVYWTASSYSLNPAAFVALPKIFISCLFCELKPKKNWILFTPANECSAFGVGNFRRSFLFMTNVFVSNDWPLIRTGVEISKCVFNQTRKVLFQRNLLPWSSDVRFIFIVKCLMFVLTLSIGSGDAGGTFSIGSGIWNGYSTEIHWNIRIKNAFRHFNFSSTRKLIRQEHRFTWERRLNFVNHSCLILIS